MPNIPGIVLVRAQSVDLHYWKADGFMMAINPQRQGDPPPILEPIPDANRFSSRDDAIQNAWQTAVRHLESQGVNPGSISKHVWNDTLNRYERQVQSEIASDILRERILGFWINNAPWEVKQTARGYESRPHEGEWQAGLPAGANQAAIDYAFSCFPSR